MALSAKDRARIVEEETLRYETRQALHQEACAKHRPRRRGLWWIGAAVVAYLVWSTFACGDSGCGFGSMGHGKSCAHHGNAGETVEPGQPIPAKK